MQNKIFIEKIKVEGLFNLFNYDIDCCKNSKVSIFIAPNGCGKSTIFNFLDFISYPSIGNFSKVENVPVFTGLFETASAIGTVGLTLGITPALGLISKIILIILMFFGRLGGLTLIYATLGEGKQQHYKYPVEKIIVG